MPTARILIWVFIVGAPSRRYRTGVGPGCAAERPPAGAARLAVGTLRASLLSSVLWRDDPVACRVALEHPVDEPRQRVRRRGDVAARATMHETDDPAGTVDERRARVAGHARDAREERVRQVRE